MFKLLGELVYLWLRTSLAVVNKFLVIHEANFIRETNLACFLEISASNGLFAKSTKFSRCETVLTDTYPTIANLDSGF